VEPSPQAKKILNELNYDFRAFTIDHFIGWIEELKQRKIVLIPWKMPSGMFGAWMSDGDEPREYVFYRDNITRLHQIHTQLHEISHFLCGHPTKLITRARLKESKEGIRELPFDELVKLRSQDINAFEYQAESLASLIQEQVIRFTQIEQLTRGISSDQKIAEYLTDLDLF
jgi:hypothetical protein